MSAVYNVFVSWSGTRSKAMGEAFRDWLPHVIQSAVPFFSDKDIASGALWDESLRASLQSVNFAVVCCTVENVTAPWLNYEAGALVERMKGGTAPWLLDGKPEELQPSPISRLQAKAADPVGTLAVLQALNTSLLAPLAPGILDSAFQTHWPKLEAKLKAIPAAETKAPQRDQREMLEEVVGLCREIARETQQSRGEDIWLEARNLLEAREILETQGPQGSQGAVFFQGKPRPLTATWGPVRERAVQLVQQHAIAATGLPFPPHELEPLLLNIRRKHKGGAQRHGAFDAFIENEVLQYLKAKNE